MKYHANQPRLEANKEWYAITRLDNGYLFSISFAISSTNVLLLEHFLNCYGLRAIFMTCLISIKLDIIWCTT